MISLVLKLAKERGWIDEWTHTGDVWTVGLVAGPNHNYTDNEVSAFCEGLLSAGTKP